MCTKGVVYDLLLNYLYHNTLVGIIVSEANNPASEASLAKFGAKRQFFASWIKIPSDMRHISDLNPASKNQNSMPCKLSHMLKFLFQGKNFTSSLWWHQNLCSYVVRHNATNILLDFLKTYRLEGVENLFFTGSFWPAKNFLIHRSRAQNFSFRKFELNVICNTYSFKYTSTRLAVEGWFLPY